MFTASLCSLCHCVTIVTVSQPQGVTVSLCHCVTVSLCHCCHSVTVSLSHCLSVSLCHCVTRRLWCPVSAMYTGTDSSNHELSA